MDSDLMNTSAVGQAMPPWLHDVFLGYGDPAGAHYRNLPDQVTEGVDFGDTLLDVDHAREVCCCCPWRCCCCWWCFVVIVVVVVVFADL